MVLSLPLASPLEDFFEIFYACFGVIRHYYFSGGLSWPAAMVQARESAGTPRLLINNLNNFY